MYNFLLNGIGLGLCHLAAATAKLWFRVMNFSKQYMYLYLSMTIFSSICFGEMFIKRGSLAIT